jgi:hypothetical protein
MILRFAPGSKSVKERQFHFISVETKEWEYHGYFSEKLTVTHKKKNRRKHSFSIQYNDTISEPPRKRT